MSGKPGKPPRLRIPENADRICRLLVEGYSLRQVAKALHIESAGSITDWVRDDAEFAVHYAHAMELRCERMAEELVEISDEGTNDWMEREGISVPDHEHIQRSRLRVDTRKWLLAKMLPKKYGDRVTQELVGDEGRPIVTRIELVPISPRRPVLEAPDGAGMRGERSSHANSVGSATPDEDPT